MDLLTQTTELDSLKTLVSEMDKIPPEYIDKFGKRQLSAQKKNEEALGTIHSDYLKRLWIVTHKLQHKETELMGRVKFEALDTNESDALVNEALRCHRLHDLAEHLFWTQLHVDMGYTPMQDGQSHSIGLRLGWLAIKQKAEDASGPPKGVIALLKHMGMIPPDAEVEGAE